MSYSINVLERYLHTVDCPSQVRQLIGAIHQYSHANNDALNHDEHIRKSASLLEKWLDEQESAEQNMHPTPRGRAGSAGNRVRNSKNALPAKSG